MLNQYQNLPFDKIPVSHDWCFKNVYSVEQWTHSYHRYPAKFLPNLVKKLIEEYSQPTDVVADFFAGCGTTLVEAKIHGRASVGVDINPVAELITKAKINAIDPKKLQRKYNSLIKNLALYDSKNFKGYEHHEKIDYWFSTRNKNKITFLFQNILKFRDNASKDFFLVSLSHILKNCSKWLQTSTKPQIDPNKKPSDPFVAFQYHTRMMLKRNKEYYNKLLEDNFLYTPCQILLEDARQTTLKSESVGVIITSPPYVTSYEYADIHQLTGYWYDYISDLPGFRKSFIGSFYSLNQNTKVTTTLGQNIVNRLLKKNKRKAKEVANYFNDMHKVLTEMHRVLRTDGHTCLVIGNTNFLGVKIKSAEVLKSILESLGFVIVQVIKRSIPHKLIPTIRNKKTGKFSTLNDKDSKRVYPEEYILIAKK